MNIGGNDQKEVRIGETIQWGKGVGRKPELMWDSEEPKLATNKRRENENFFVSHEYL